MQLISELITSRLNGEELCMSIHTVVIDLLTKDMLSFESGKYSKLFIGILNQICKINY